MQKKDKMSICSVVALILSIIALILYEMVFYNSGIYYVWILASVTAFVFPVLAKRIRVKAGKRGKWLEIAALVLGSFDFYCVIFAATKWNINIAFALIAIVCVLYAKLSNKGIGCADANAEENAAAEELATDQKTETLPAPQVSATPQKSKQRYCKYCGGAIDGESRKCTKCGKQYFKLRINKKAVKTLCLFITIVLLLAGNLYQYYRYQRDIAPNSKNSGQTIDGWYCYENDGSGTVAQFCDGSLVIYDISPSQSFRTEYSIEVVFYEKIEPGVFVDGDRDTYRFSGADSAGVIKAKCNDRFRIVSAGDTKIWDESSGAGTYSRRTTFCINGDSLFLQFSDFGLERETMLNKVGVLPEWANDEIAYIDYWRNKMS